MKIIFQFFFFFFFFMNKDLCQNAWLKYFATNWVFICLCHSLEQTKLYKKKKFKKVEVKTQ